MRELPVPEINAEYPHHHVSEEHLDRYVGEFVFRYNNRKVSDGEWAQKVRGWFIKRR